MMQQLVPTTIERSLESNSMHVNVIFVTLVLVATSATIVLLFKDESGIIRILFVNI